MAAKYALPPPIVLEIHDQNVAEKWKRFRLAWESYCGYSLATELSEKPEPVQVATLLTIIGEEARDVFSVVFVDMDGDGLLYKTFYYNAILDKINTRLHRQPVL